MIEANDRAVSQGRGRGRFGEIDLWNGDRHWRDLKKHLHLSQLQSVARLENGLFNHFAIDESAVGRAAIPDRHCALLENDFAMQRRNSGVLDWEIVVAPAPQPIAPGPQFDRLGTG